MPWMKSCLCHQEKKKATPAISPPIHLLLKTEDSALHGPNHAFRCKTFKKPRPCHLCHQPILNQGSCCRVCKYVCHKVCESKEAAQRYTDTSWQIHWDNRKDGKKRATNNTKNSHPSSLKTANSRQTEEIDHEWNGTVDNNDKLASKIESCEKNNNETEKNDNSDSIRNGDSDTGTIIQVETVEIEYEPVRSPTQIELHSHEEPTKDGTEVTKMITSSSYNGFGEALTSQPRPSRRNANLVPGNMDLSYVTERIIAIWFPSSSTSHSYRQGQRQAGHMLRPKHGNNYMVFNLTEPKRALNNEHKHVKEVGWAHNLAPPLEHLCSVCKEIESWLSGDQHRIAVLHARGNKDKLGVIVASYMHYSSICGNAEQALDRFWMRKFLDDNIGSFSLPSNKRYVDYFSGLLSHNIKVNHAPLYLTHVTVLGAPSFQQGGCKAFLKLYQGQVPVYTSGVYSVSRGVCQFTVNVAGERRKGLSLRGDILIKCYHREEAGRETVFACQFHTCAVTDYTLSFTKQELDVAYNDPRFPNDGAVELHFSPGPEVRHPAPAPTPAVPFTMTDDPVTRADSPTLLEESEEDEDYDLEDVSHTFGPLDGSIYATIAKKPELSPGAVSSPLTVSMDSGISSAGHQHNANTTASASPPLTAQPSPLTPEEQHRELDELLSDMMLTVESIPDLKPQRQDQQQSLGTATGSNNGSFNLENVSYIDEEEDKNIPYHARQDSRPFSYGVNTTMINDAKNLSSPSLVRKASVNQSSSDTVKKVQTQVYPNFYNYQSSQYNNNNTPSKYSNYSPTLRKNDPIDDIFTTSALSANQPIKREFREEYYKEEVRRHHEPLKRSLTEGTLRKSPEKFNFKTSNSVNSSSYSDSESLSPPRAFRNSTKSPEFHESYTTTSNLTWLQTQQLKLKERMETKQRQERLPHDSLLLSELRTIQNRRQTENDRRKAYVDNVFTEPLHINTLQGSSLSMPTEPDYSHGIRSGSMNERPMIMERKHFEEFTKFQDRDESINTWRSQAANDIDSPTHNSSSSPRPQTPAFPVHARTPYPNATTPTVQFDLRSERLPPKSPTTQRRLSYPSNAICKKWSLSPERKDRPTSPNEYMNGSLASEENFHQQTLRSVSATPTSGYREFSEGHSPKSIGHNGSASPVTLYYGNSRRSSINSNGEPPVEVAPAHVKFVRDTSRFWYKPSITREEAINILRDQPPGAFIVRDSNSFVGAYGLALRVATIPSNVQGKSGGPDDLIRHFLIEPTSRGVRLKGCQNEPIFTSLSALVYQHSITQMALPSQLILPEHDMIHTEIIGNPAEQALTQGAACNVLYICTLDMESLTGPQAIKKAVLNVLQKAPLPETAVVHFKVNAQGITLTDNKRKLFFRKHYPVNSISHCGIDPDEKQWATTPSESGGKSANRIFGFVARKPNVKNSDNQCHLFAELEPEQPAIAIVNFVNKILTSTGVKPNMV